MSMREIPRELLMVPVNTMNFVKASFLSSEQQEFVERLRVEEPRTRALTALGSAKRAISKTVPDYELAVFESWRASGAALVVAREEEELIIPRADIDLVRAVRQGVVGLSERVAHPPQRYGETARQFMPVGFAAVQLATQAQKIALARPQEVTHLHPERH